MKICDVCLRLAAKGKQITFRSGNPYPHTGEVQLDLCAEHQIQLENAMKRLIKEYRLGTENIAGICPEYFPQPLPEITK